VQIDNISMKQYCTYTKILNNKKKNDT